MPACFGEREREAVRSAGLSAGLSAVEIINEPTAAAIAYGYGAGTYGRQRIMVFDLGGGTLDISVMDIAGDEFTAVTSDGDPCLGGRDFDRVLTSVMLERMATECGSDPEILESDSGVMARMELLSESTRIRLSSTDHARCSVTIGGDQKVDFGVSRLDLERASEHLVEECLRVSDRALSRVAMGADSLDAILLVGG